jgi:LysR family glycine cleavage system transcriptional activator
LQSIDDSRLDSINFSVSHLSNDQDGEIEIRYGLGSPSPGYWVQPFLFTDYVLVCSPTMQSKLKHPADIQHFVQIHDDTIPDERLRPSWDTWCAKAGISLDLTASGPHFHDYGMVLAAVADGMGTALSPRQLIGQDLAAGRIVAPFDISVPSAYCYYFVVPETIISRPEVHAFCEWIQLEATS